MLHTIKVVIVGAYWALLKTGALTGPNPMDHCVMETAPPQDQGSY